MAEDIIYEITGSIDPKIKDTEEAIKTDPGNQDLQELLDELQEMKEQLGNSIEGYTENLT